MMFVHPPTVSHIPQYHSSLSVPHYFFEFQSNKSNKFDGSHYLTPSNSPIRRLNNDILREIFYHCLPTHRNPTMSKDEAPRILTRISPLWRCIALSTPRLWSRLHIPIAPSYGYSVNGLSKKPSSQDEICFLPKFFHQNVKKWLTRSGGCPLYLSISTSDQLNSRFGQEEDKSLYNEVFSFMDMLLSFSDRWYEIELITSLALYDALQKRISDEVNIPIMRSLRLEIHDTNGYRFSGNGASLRLLETRSLQRISVFSSCLLAAVFARETTVGHRLSHLSIHSPCNINYLVRLLTECHNLVHCKIVLSSTSFEDDHDTDVPITLPSLRFLTVIVSDANIKTRLLERMHVPSLESFGYLAPYNTYTVTSYNLYDANPNLFIYSFLENHPQITTLFLDDRVVNKSDAITCLKLAYNVRRLVICSRPLTADVGWLESFSFPTSKPFDFSLLSVDPDCDVGDILLPRLERLEAVDSTKGLSDDLLFRIIKSRFYASQQYPGQVNKLHGVKAEFHRPKEMDIKTAVKSWNAYARSGLGIDLTYSPAPNTLLPRYSGSDYHIFYGIRQGDVSWRFEKLDGDEPY